VQREFLLAVALACAAAAPAQAQGRPRDALEASHLEYRTSVDQAVTVTQTVLRHRGWRVTRVERSHRDRVIWARHDDRVMRVTASPREHHRVMISALLEGRERSWLPWRLRRTRGGDPQDIISDIDSRLHSS
jgi:hypothetical protein